MSDNAPKKKGKSAFTLILIGVVIGIIFWGGFNTAMEATNSETFCISCHEMEVNVYEEYTDTIHYTNRTGVRATCPDCHVPKDWIHKFVRKVQATNELYHHFQGTIDTPKKFEEKRFELAQNVWRAMKSTDSRECRNCHAYDYMAFDKQEARAMARHEDMDAGTTLQHTEAKEAGLTCIDCHKGIAHRLPAEYDPEKDIPGESIYYTKSQ